MAHRDDHEAALSRIAALERELANSKNQTAEKAAELATLREELENQQRSSEGRGPKARRERRSSTRSTKLARGPIIYGLVLLAIAIGLMFLIKDPM